MSFWISAVNSVILCTSPCAQDVIPSRTPAFRWNSIERWEAEHAQNTLAILLTWLKFSSQFWMDLNLFQSFCCFFWRFSIWFAFICEQLAWTPKHQTLLPGQSLRRPTRRRDPALSQRCSCFFREEVGPGWSVGITLMEEMLLTSGYGNFPHLFTGLHTGAGGFLLSTIPFPFTTHSPTRYYPCIVHVLASKTSWWNVGGSSSQVTKQVWNHQEDTYSWLFMVQ